MRQPVGSEKVGEACGRRSSDEHLVLAVERGGGHFPLSPSAEQLKYNGHPDAGIVRGQALERECADGSARDAAV